MRILVSAGEASGDMYAGQLVESLRKEYGPITFFGCTGTRLREAGVETIIDSRKLSVVGLAEVVTHLPGIYAEYRRLLRHLRRNPPQAAILTDSPDFHLRLARHLRRMNVPVFYLVAPQAWAWRAGRARQIAARVKHLFCLFPFEEQWFRERHVNASYIGHPLATMVKPRQTKQEFCARHGIDGSLRMVALLPGSRAGEARRHMPDLLDTSAILRNNLDLEIVVGTPEGFKEHGVFEKFKERIAALAIKVVEGETWDLLAHADLALAASGTVTIEAAILQTPMITFYKVTNLSWWLGRWLVKAPFFSMVNLVAGRFLIPEFIQQHMKPSSLAAAALLLLTDSAKANEMRRDLAALKTLLTGPDYPFECAAKMIAADLGHARIS